MTSTTHFQGQSNLTELFTVVYVLVDDYLKTLQRVGHFKLPEAVSQKGNYAKLMTIALVGELRSQAYVSDWFEFVKVEYGALFPVLPHRTRCTRPTGAGLVPVLVLDHGRQADDVERCRDLSNTALYSMSSRSGSFKSS